MFRRCVFYNWYGNGDLFNSREFVKDIMMQFRDLGVNEFYYAHGKVPRFFEDIDDLQYMRINEFCDNSKHYNFAGTDAYVDIYINTWIGLEAKYVLPGIGCTIRKNREMYNDMFAEMNLSIHLDKDYLDYLPQIDFSKINPDAINRMNLWLSQHLTKKIIIANGPVHSGQAENFDMNPIVDMIATEYPNRLILYTQRFDAVQKNAIYTGDITQTEDDFDLNEIAYLSLNAEAVISRASGPATFTQVKENCLDKHMKYIVFSYGPAVTYFAYPDHIPAQIHWSEATDKDEIMEVIREVLDE